MVTFGVANFTNFAGCSTCWCLAHPEIGDGQACLCLVASWSAVLAVTGLTSVASALLAATAVAAAAAVADVIALAATAAAADLGGTPLGRSHTWRWQWQWWGAAGAAHRLGTLKLLVWRLCVAMHREPLDGYE